MRTKLIALLLLLSPALAWAHQSGSGMGWFGTQIVSSIIHGIIYGIIFKIFHALGLFPSIIVGGLILGITWLVYKRSN